MALSFLNDSLTWGFQQRNEAFPMPQIKEGYCPPEKVVFWTDLHLLGQDTWWEEGGEMCWPSWPDQPCVLAGGPQVCFSHYTINAYPGCALHRHAHAHTYSYTHAYFKLVAVKREWTGFLFTHRGGFFPPYCGFKNQVIHVIQVIHECLFYKSMFFKTF